MKPVKTFLMRGKRWKLRWMPRAEGERRKLHGFCNYDIRRIDVRRELAPRDELETIIHEALHAAFPDMHDEEWGPIDETAHDLARLLGRLGYKREE